MKLAEIRRQSGASATAQPNRCRLPTAGCGLESGFTLVELIVVIVLIGILSGIAAVFITHPVQGYVDAARRAELVDIANTALSRMARDVRAALPNSVRVSQSGGVHYLEFLAMKTGGRYRAEPTGAGGGDILDFASGSDAAFDVLGPPVGMAGGEAIVIYNLGLGAGTDAYAGGNRRAYSGAPGSQDNLGFTATGTPFPFESPGRRFFTVSGPVTYACDPAAGSLRRYWGYAIQAAQPASTVAAPLSTASSALLASRVTGCRFAYEPGASERLGQLTLWLQIADAGEPLSLYREVVVNNEP